MQSTKNESTTDLLIACGLLTLGIVARLVPHPANFAPLAAIAIFGGLYLPKRLAIILPVSAMLIGDVIIGFYSWKIMLVVYAAFGFTGYMATKIKDNFLSVLAVTLSGSILFYLTTNGAVWAFGTMYVHDFHGLIQSYTMALPFFRNSLLGDLFFTGVLVGLYSLYKLIIINFRTNHHTQSLLRNQS